MATLSAEDGARIERKLDMILAEMGLSENRRHAPIEIEKMAQAAVLEFRRKQEKKVKK